MSPDQYSAYMEVDLEYRKCFGVYEYESEVYYVIPYFVSESEGGDQFVTRCEECKKKMYDIEFLMRSNMSKSSLLIR